MNSRSAILGVLALTLVLALRERFVAPRGATSSAASESAPAAAIPAHSAHLHSGNRARATSVGTPETEALPVESRLEEALAALPVTNDSENWSPALDRLADSVPIGELGSVVRESTDAGSDGLRAMLRERLLARWTRLAPEAAAAWAISIPNPTERSETVIKVAITWAESDSTSAAVWARSLSAENARDDVLLAIANESVRDEPLRALELASELAASHSRNELIAQAAGTWALRDPKAAADWASSLQADSGREPALESVVVNWAATDAIAAAKFTLENLPNGRTFDRAMVAVLQRWAQTDPNSAANWLEQFEPGALQSAAAEGLLANWFADDVQAPAHWLESLQPGALRDNSIASYARQLASIDKPTLASAWVSRIGNEDLRRRARQTVAAFAPPATLN